MGTDAGRAPAASLLAAFNAEDVSNGKDVNAPAARESARESFAKVSTPNPLLHEFLDRRVVRINGPITDETATAVIAMLNLLDDMAPGKEIELRINSPGGSVKAGLAIYDALMSLHSDVRTVCEGQCASMAAFLLSVGAPGKRYATPSSTVMMHDISSGGRGSLADLKIDLKEAERLKEKMLDIYEQHTGLERRTLEKLMDRDRYMSPEEAKALNLIDEVIEPRRKPPYELSRRRRDEEREEVVVRFPLRTPVPQPVVQ